MPDKFSLQWNSASVHDVLSNMTSYEKKVGYAVLLVGQFIAAKMEASAKTNARWIDRTGNARQSLHAFAEQVARDVVEIYLAHGMIYGVQLELRYQGRYAIILETMQSYYGEIMDMLDAVFR